MRAAEAWLRARAAGAPDRLIDSMVEALPVSAASDADAMAAGAVTLYERVLQGDGGRGDALPLLAADALLTHAFQACAEAAPEDLTAFAERWGGGGRLGEVLR